MARADAPAVEPATVTVETVALVVSTAAAKMRIERVPTLVDGVKGFEWRIPDADPSWRPERGVALVTWMAMRIRWAVTDAMRRLHGTHRRPGSTAYRPQAAHDELPLDGLIAPDDLAEFEAGELEAWAREHIAATFDPRTADCVLAPLDGVPPAAVAAKWGVTRSRVSQIRTAAVARLAADPKWRSGAGQTDPNPMPRLRLFGRPPCR